MYTEFSVFFFFFLDRNDRLNLVSVLLAMIIGPAHILLITNLISVLMYKAMEYRVLSLIALFIFLLINRQENKIV